MTASLMRPSQAALEPHQQQSAHCLWILNVRIARPEVASLLAKASAHPVLGCHLACGWEVMVTAWAAGGGEGGVRMGGDGEGWAAGDDEGGVRMQMG